MTLLVVIDIYFFIVKSFEIKIQSSINKLKISKVFQKNFLHLLFHNTHEIYINNVSNSINKMEDNKKCNSSFH